MGARVDDLGGAGRQLPLADGGEDLEVGREGRGGDIEADLVVALAGAAVGDGRGLLFPGDIDEQLGDERPRQRGGERVAALVEGAGHHGLEDEGAREGLLRVGDDQTLGAGRQGALLQGAVVLQEARRPR